MNYSALSSDVLEATMTEDDYALWEIAGMARTRFPGASEAAINARAREALEPLIRDGLVRIYRRTGQRELTLAGLELADALAQDSSWEVESYNEGLFVASTPDGERAHESR
jgi:hypothetical protein